MAQYTKDNIRGLLIHDPRLENDDVLTGQSSYSQAGVKAGFPALTSTNGSKLNVSATGDRSSESDINIYVNGSGIPSAKSGRFLWSKNDESGSSFRGWDPPYALSDWSPVHWGYDAEVVGAADQLGAFTTQDETLLCAYRRWNTTDDWDIAIRRKTATATSFTEIDVELLIPAVSSPKSGTDPRDYKFPTFMQLPDGKLFIYFYDYNTDTTWWNIKSYVSVDDGATWTLNSEACLVSYIGDSTGDIYGPVPYNTAGAAATYYSEVGRFSVAYANGLTVLCLGDKLANSSLVNDRRFKLRFYVSEDFGNTFKLSGNVGDADTDTGFADPIIYTDGKNFVVYCLYSLTVTATAIWALCKIPMQSAYVIPRNIDDAISISDITNVDEDVANFTLAYDNKGTIWAYLDINFVTPSDKYKIKVYSSHDYGSTWNEHKLAEISATDLWVHIQYNTNDTRITRIAATYYKNCVMLFHNHTDNASSYEGSIGCMQLGGWTRVNMPSFWEKDSNDHNRATWQYLYTPGSIPDSDTSWSYTSTGAPVVGTSATGYYSIVTDPAETAYYLSNLGTVNGPILAKWCCKSDAQAPLSDDTGETAVILSCRNASPYDYTVQINIYQTGFIVRDVNAGSNLATITPSGMTGAYVHYMACLDGSGNLKVWYKVGEMIDGDGDYTLAGTYTGLTQDAATVNPTRITWGNRIAPSVAVTSTWKYVAFSYGDVFTNSGILATASNGTADKFGSSLAPYSTWTGDGVRVSFQHGPAFYGETFKIEANYTYGYKNMLPDYEPSPSVGWRSQSDNTAMYIALNLDSTTASLLSPVVGMYLKGINFPTGKLQGYTGAWVDICSFSSVILTAAPYTLNGSSVIPSATSYTATRYIRHGELIGSYIVLGTGKPRKITYNTSGYWTNSASTKRVTLLVEGIDGTETASGTGDVWYSEVFAAGYQAFSTEYVAYRLYIDAAQTAEDYYTVGTAIIGPFFPFSQDFSYGKIETTQPNVSVTTNISGRKKTKVNGPLRRKVAFAWEDGIDEAALYDLTPATILPAGSPAIPAALRGDVVQDITGIYRDLNGEATPIVFIQSLPYGTSTNTSTWNLCDSAMTLYGRIVGDLETQNVLGNEYDEVRQVNTIVIEEEL